MRHDSRKNNGSDGAPASTVTLGTNTPEHAHPLPPPGPWGGRRYYAFSYYLHQRFGTRVHRVPIDAGFACPHRDRQRRRVGCLYCDDRGSAAPGVDPGLPVEEQLRAGMDYGRRRFRADRFIAYFQAYSNTLADPDALAALYDRVWHIPEVVGMAVATRPDLASEGVLDVLAACTRRGEIWVEYGVESIHDRTLQQMNRDHTYAQAVDAIRRTAGRGLKTAVHVILGLPGESREDMLATADAVAGLPIDGVKVHSLYVEEGMPLAAWYRRGLLRLMDQDTFVALAADFLERVPPHVTIQRLVGEGDRRKLLAPRWSLHKAAVLAAIQSTLERRGTVQGDRWMARQQGGLHGAVTTGEEGVASNRDLGYLIG